MTEVKGSALFCGAFIIPQGLQQQHYASAADLELMCSEATLTPDLCLILNKIIVGVGFGGWRHDRPIPRSTQKRGVVLFRTLLLCWTGLLPEAELPLFLWLYHLKTCCSSQNDPLAAAVLRLDLILGS